MRRILWSVGLVALAGLSPRARAGEPPRGPWADDGDVQQAGCHKKCGSRGCDSCDPCDRDAVRIGRLICELDSADHACTRKCAAEKLSKYDWRCHPEIVAALLGAMQSDCDAGVRKCAAASLKCMKACEPDVVGAMQYTREADPSWWVRCKAKCGAKKLEHDRPPVLTYVSSVGPAKKDPGDKPELLPAPKPMQRRSTDDLPDPERKRNGDPKEPSDGVMGSVKSWISTAAAKVRQRD